MTDINLQIFEYNIKYICLISHRNKIKHFKRGYIFILTVHRTFTRHDSMLSYFRGNVK